MKITLSELRKVIREELSLSPRVAKAVDKARGRHGKWRIEEPSEEHEDSDDDKDIAQARAEVPMVSEAQNAIFDNVDKYPKLNSWVNWVASLPQYNPEFETVWNSMTSGEHADFNSFAKSLDDILPEDAKSLRNSITFHARQIIQNSNKGMKYPSWDEILDEIEKRADQEIERRNKGTTVIAGTRVKVASMDKISKEIDAVSRENQGRPRSDTHALWPSDKTTPEEAIKDLVQRAKGLPGKLTIYQDPDTQEVFGWAQYNTF